MNTTKRETTPSALSAAIEGIIRRSDEITAACEGERDALAALFTPKEISRSIDICKALITAVAKTRNAAELTGDAALIGRLRERTMTANNLLAARTTGNPHLVTAAIFCEEMLFGLMLDGNPALLTMAKTARVGSLAVSAALRATFTQMRDLIAAGDRERILKVEIVKSEKPKTSGKAHAKQTPYMLEQLRIFRAYLDTHPVCASYSIINRARQCWNEHKAEWDKAAGNKTGYACYKNLAQAV